MPVSPPVQGSGSQLSASSSAMHSQAQRRAIRIWLTTHFDEHRNQSLLRSRQQWVKRKQMRANWQPTTGIASKEDGIMTSRSNQVQFDEDEWPQMAALAGVSENNSASAKLEIEKVLSRFSQEQATREMPGHQIKAASGAILASAQSFERHLRRLRETKELREAYAMSFPIRKPTAKDKQIAERGLFVWSLALEEAAGDPNRAASMVTRLINGPKKNEEEMWFLRAIADMYALHEKHGAQQANQSALLVAQLTTALSQFVNKLEAVKVPQAKRGPPDQVGALIEVMVFMVRDIADGKFKFSKCTGPAEFVRRAIKKLRLNLSDATINNKIKLVLKNVR